MRQEGLVVAAVGGGSSYTPELVEGLLARREELPVRELRLVDVEAGREKMEIVAALARRMAAKAGVPLEVTATLDRRAAIRGADFVLTQFRVGGLDARIRDEARPLAFGRIGQETTGAGGFAKALRTIPVVLDVCRDMRELAPGAFLVNFANPSGMVAEAVLKHGGVPVVGLCNLPLEMKMQAAAALGADPARVRTEMFGINHLTWCTGVWVDGIDRTAEAVELAASGAAFGMKNIPSLAWPAELVRSLGAVPCGYHRYYYLRDAMLAKQLKERESGGRGVLVKALEAELFKAYADPDLAEKPPQLAQRGGAWYSTAAVNVMASIASDKGDVQVVGARNGGAVPCLGDDCCVEVACSVDRRGAHPIATGRQGSPEMRGLLQAVKAYEELAIRAAVEKDYGVALQALVAHPLVGDAAAAKGILDDILEADRAFLGEFR